MGKAKTTEKAGISFLKRSQHLPIVVLVAVVALIFLLSLVLYQVPETEYAVVKRFGSPQLERRTAPGLHLRWPWPIEEIWRHDNRIQVFTGTKGELEEVYSADRKNLIVTVFITWKIMELPPDSNEGKQERKEREKQNNEYRIKYMNAVKTQEEAENKLTDLLRDAKRSVFGKHDFSALVNIDPGKVKIAEIEDEMLAELKQKASELYAIEVKSLGVCHLGLPEDVTQQVFARMKAEREREAKEITSKGEAEAEKIRATAERDKLERISQAQKEAKQIRAEGDQLANEWYKRFQKNPELAIFLRQLVAVRKILKDKTYLILDTTTPPLNVMTLETLQKLSQGQLGSKPKKTTTGSKPQKTAP